MNRREKFENSLVWVLACIFFEGLCLLPAFMVCMEITRTHEELCKWLASCVWHVFAGIWLYSIVLGLLLLLLHWISERRGGGGLYGESKKAATEPKALGYLAVALFCIQYLAGAMIIATIVTQKKASDFNILLTAWPERVIIASVVTLLIAIPASIILDKTRDRLFEKEQAAAMK